MQDLFHSLEKKAEKCKYVTVKIKIVLYGEGPVKV